MKRSLFLALPATTALLLALTSRGADGPSQAIDVEGLSFKAPASWKKVAPANAMRKAQFRVEAPMEGSEPAELSISTFGGGGGGTKANIERWRGQFKDKAGKGVDAETKTTPGDNCEITRVEVAGTFTDPFSKAGPQADYRLLGAIIANDRSAYFVKLIGPDKTVLAAEADFDAMLKSVKVAKP